MRVAHYVKCAVHFFHPPKNYYSHYLNERHVKVHRPSGPNYWKMFEWIPHVLCKAYCSECQTTTVMRQKFDTSLKARI